MRWRLVGGVLCGLLMSMVRFGGPVSAATQPPACDREHSAVFRAAGDRYRAQRDFVNAARWYVAATRHGAGCDRPDDLLLNAHAIALAGTAYAQSGDYLQALSFLHQAQSRLTALSAAPPSVANDARAYADRVEKLISVIDEVAQSSM